MNKQNTKILMWLTWMAPVLLLIAAIVSFVTGHTTEGFTMLVLAVVFGVVGPLATSRSGRKYR